MEPLAQREPDSKRDGAIDLPVDRQRVDPRAGVADIDVVQEPYLSGFGVDVEFDQTGVVSVQDRRRFTAPFDLRFGTGRLSGFAQMTLYLDQTDPDVRRFRGEDGVGLDRKVFRFALQELCARTENRPAKALRRQIHRLAGSDR